MNQMPEPSSCKILREGNLATLLLDVPSARVNTISGKVLEDLHTCLDELESARGVEFLLVRSAKDGCFVAGADMREFSALADPEQARKAARAGQKAFDRLARLPFPSLAVIDGACMGGGCEMALACDFRLATDGPRTRIGLPEVNLGILPAWGGTQRLPRLLGFTTAMDMILSARVLDARRALRSGLVDRVCAVEFLEEAVEQFVRERLPKGKSRSGLRRHPGIVTRFLDDTAPGRWLAARTARKAVLRKTGGHLHGPIEALRLLELAGDGILLPDGLEREAEAFAFLPSTSQSRALVGTFFASEEAKKVVVSDHAVPADIGKVGVLGAGIMGGGIGWAFTSKGMSARLRDLSSEALGKGFGAAWSANLRQVRAGRLKESDARMRMHRLQGTLGWDGFAGCDLVVEAVVEDLEIKRKVLAEAEEHVGPDCVIATNTSSLRLADMASALGRPERFVGMHFFNPVPRMPLVEVVRGASSDPRSVEAVVRTVRKLGKTPVVVADGAGFLVNRILLPYVNEAARILEEGSCIGSIDRALRAWGMPMGPFELADAVGIDVGWKVAKVLHQAYGERMEVSPLWELVHDGLKLRGDKSGAGFRIGKGSLRRINPAVERLVAKRRGGAGRRISATEIVDRCVLVMVSEAGRCLSEGVVASGALLDLAMVTGTGWPAWRGGPVREARDRGQDELTTRLEVLARRLGGRFQPDGTLDALFAEPEAGGAP